MGSQPVPSATAKERLILGLLVEKGRMNGGELVKHSAAGLKRGTVYVMLDRLVNKGYIEWIEEEPAEGPALRIYGPTGLGVRVYRSPGKG